MAFRYDGHPCGNAATEFLACGITICHLHNEMLIEDILQATEAKRERMQLDFKLAAERLHKLDRVKPTLRKEDAGWSFDLGLPAIGGEPRRRIRRRGFKTKRDAQAEARQILDNLKAPLQTSAEAFGAAVKEEQRRTLERWAEADAETEAARRAANESAGKTRRERERARLVYYVRRPDGAIKIGTTWNLESRMQAFRNVSTVDLLAVHSGGQVAEAALHRRFKHLRLDGEWFQPGQDLLAHIRHVIGRSNRHGTVAA